MYEEIKEILLMFFNADSRVKEIFKILLISGCVDIWIIVLIKIYDKISIWLKNHANKNKEN